MNRKQKLFIRIRLFDIGLFSFALFLGYIAFNRFQLYMYICLYCLGILTGEVFFK